MVVEAPDPGQPGAHEAIVDLVASPVHPSDLLTISGGYALGTQTLPRTPGKEGVGRVTKVGSMVRHVKPGDLTPIELPDDGVWQERHLLPAETLIALPGNGEPFQYAMMIVNPVAAYLMLRDVVELTLGDWVIQNAANSAVGQYLILLAKREGFRTINVVRTPDSAEFLHSLGADVVLVDGQDLAARVARATGGAAVRLAIDAVSGDAAARLIECLAPGGTLCNYGALSGQPLRVHPAQLIFRGVHVRGYWNTPAFRQAPKEKREKVLAALIPLAATGLLKARVEATYPLSRIREALAHAARPGREGKILVIPG